MAYISLTLYSFVRTMLIIQIKDWRRHFFLSKKNKLSLFHYLLFSKANKRVELDWLQSLVAKYFFLIIMFNNPLKQNQNNKIIS